MACPAVARRPRATQRERTRPERRSTREPSFINEHSASSMSLRSHSIQNAQRQTALLQPSSRAAVDERRRALPIRARSSASSLVQPDPTANAHHCKSHSASALNQPPAHRAAESTQLSTTASRPRPWATEGPSAADQRARDAERRARRHHKRRTRRQLPRQTGDASGR